MSNLHRSIIGKFNICKFVLSTSAMSYVRRFGQSLVRRRNSNTKTSTLCKLNLKNEIQSQKLDFTVIKQQKNISKEIVNKIFHR